MKAHPVQRFVPLGACDSTSHLQHTSVSLEATVLSKCNQHALTWPSLYETARNSTRPLLWFSGGDCGTSSWTSIFPALVPVASPLKPPSISLTPKPALGTFCHGLKREAQHKRTRKCHREPSKLSCGRDCCKTKPVLNTDGRYKPWSCSS